MIWLKVVSFSNSSMDSYMPWNLKSIRSVSKLQWMTLILELLSQWGHKDYTLWIWHEDCIACSVLIGAGKTVVFFFFYLALKYLVVFTWHCVWLSPKDNPDKERKQRKKKKSKNGKKSYTAVPSVEFDFLSLPLSSFPQASIFEPV